MSSVGLDRQRSAAMIWTVAGYMLEPFMADAVVARPKMHYQGHVAHDTSRLHHSVQSLRDLHSLGPAALGV